MAPFGRVQGILKRPNSSNFGKNTRSTHGKRKGINLSTTTQIQLFVRPLALNKEGRGRSCSGSPLGSSGVTCMRPGYNKHWISSWLFSFCTLAVIPWGAEESFTEVPPLWRWSLAQGRPRGAQKPLEWDSEPRHPRMAEL